MSKALLPANATPAELAVDLSVGDRIEAIPTPARSMWNPQTIPVDFLPWLAWARSVDEWDVTWTEAQKRSAITAAYTVQRQKGTVGAIERALSALGLGIQIIEWFQESPQGAPYTFRIAVSVDQGGAGQEQLAKMISVVNSAKNLRSHLLSVGVSVESSGTAYYAATTLTGHGITIEPEA